MQCEPGLQCSPGRVCVAPGNRGGGCDAGLPCRLPLTCIGGLCQDPLPLGAPCDPVQGGCDTLRGHYCTAVNGQTMCQAMTFADLGEPCGPNTMNGIVNCKGDGWCSSANGRCEARPEAGQPCDPALSVCRSTASCTEGVCRLPDPTRCD